MSAKSARIVKVGVWVMVACLLGVGAFPIALSQSGTQIFLPATLKGWPPIPAAPVLSPIDNSDLDNAFQINWSVPQDAGLYVFQEASDPGFVNVSTAWDIPNTSWNATNKVPATYYYRVASFNSYGVGPWSNVQSVTVYPLFVGLQFRYDGNGYIRTSQSFDVGTHTTHNFDLKTDVDIIRDSGRDWYDPDPQAWGSSTWTSYYSASTGDWQSSTSTGDPAWKWGYPWKTDYGSEFSNGQAYVGGQPFSVTGPHAGVTAFGVSMNYWEMTNTTAIVLWDGGAGWTQVLEPGTVVLRYDAGPSRLMLYSDLLRRYYYNGAAQTQTVRYTEVLTAVSFFNGHSGSVPMTGIGAQALPALAPAAAPRPQDGPGPILDAPVRP